MNVDVGFVYTNWMNSIKTGNAEIACEFIKLILQAYIYITVSWICKNQ